MRKGLRYLFGAIAAFAVGALLTASTGKTFASYSDYRTITFTGGAATWGSGCQHKASGGYGNGVGHGSGNLGSDNGKGNNGCDNGYGKTGCPTNGKGSNHGNGSCKSNESQAVQSMEKVQAAPAATQSPTPGASSTPSALPTPSSPATSAPSPQGD